jgi:methylglyoxal synthase
MHIGHLICRPGPQVDQQLGGISSSEATVFKNCGMMAIGATVHIIRNMQGLSVQQVAS